MTDCYAGIGYFTANQILYLVNILDTVIDKENLSVTAHLEIDRFTDNIGVETLHFRLYRIPVGRGSGDAAQVAGTHQRELQSSRDRCRCHCQRIHIHFHLTKFFLNGYAELLLFIDDKQSQVFELDIFADNTMRTDQDVHLTVGDIHQRPFDLCRSPCPADIIDPAGEIFQTLRKSLEMLESKNCCRNQYGYLLVIGNGLEGSTDRYLCLAETYVTTDQAIHRT